MPTDHCKEGYDSKAFAFLLSPSQLIIVQSGKIHKTFCYSLLVKYHASYRVSNEAVGYFILRSLWCLFAG